MRDARLSALSALVGLIASPALAQPVTVVSPNGEPAGRFGASIAGVPDVDNNGRGEIAIGAPNETVAGVGEAGRAYLYSAYGLRKLTLVSPSPGQAGGQFGAAVAGVADTNGDFKGDLLVGAPFENPGVAPADSGRAYLFSGATGVRRLTLASPNAEPLGLFGLAVAGLADITGDGKGDLLIGAPNENPGGSPADCGRAYLFNGYTGAFIRTLASPSQQANGGFGTSVAAVPDLNGDGRGDFVVGALFEHPGLAPDRAGRAYVYSGATGTLLFTLVSPQQQADGTFGNSVAGVPDVNGDGKGDILVGAPYEKVGANPDASGRAYLFSGANGALLRQFAAGGPVENDIFGFSVAGCSDLNGDGRGDIIIGAKAKSVAGSPANAGRVYVYSGATGAFIKTLVSPNQEAGGEFGAAVAGLSNMNGDGKGNPGVGAPKEDVSGKADAGRAYIYKQ
jgi:hypothetical protein